MSNEQARLLWETSETLGGFVRLVASYTDDQLTGMLIVYPDTRPEPFEGSQQALRFDADDVRRIRRFCDNILPDDLDAGLIVEGDQAAINAALTPPSAIAYREDLPRGPSWGFWDETWGSFLAGFVSEEDAKAGLAVYLEYLETGEDHGVRNPDLYWERG